MHIPILWMPLKGGRMHRDNGEFHGSVGYESKSEEGGQRCHCEGGSGKDLASGHRIDRRRLISNEVLQIL